jgi:hypothetical protein
MALAAPQATRSPPLRRHVCHGQGSPCVHRSGMYSTLADPAQRSSRHWFRWSSLLSFFLPLLIYCFISSSMATSVLYLLPDFCLPFPLWKGVRTGEAKDTDWGTERWWVVLIFYCCRWGQWWRCKTASVIYTFFFGSLCNIINLFLLIIN